MPSIKKEMRERISEFTAYEIEQPGGPKIKLTPLSKPIYTYTDKQRNIDFGAIFAFAHEKNPEVLITLESTEGGLSCELLRAGGAEMHVTWKGREIWNSDAGDGQPREHKPVSYVSFNYEDLIQEKL